MKFLTMMEVDLRKILPFLLGLFIMAIVGFQGLFFMGIKTLNEELNSGAIKMEMVISDYVKTIQPISMNAQMDSFPFPLLFGAIIGMLLILFGFFLWYKEWFGASKRIYTLLTLKGSRMRIFTSKLMVFLLIFLSYYAIGYLNIYLASLSMQVFLPEGAAANNLVQDFIMQSPVIPYVLPNSMAKLAFHIAFLVMMFMILSAAVLMDRSKRMWGLMTGIIYIISSIVLFFYIFTLPLYTEERILVNWLFTGSFLLLSLLISYYLLKRKVSI